MCLYAYADHLLDEPNWALIRMVYLETDLQRRSEARPILTHTNGAHIGPASSQIQRLAIKTLSVLPISNIFRIFLVIPTSDRVGQ
jgi:hypothetical protein